MSHTTNTFIESFPSKNRKYPTPKLNNKRHWIITMVLIQKVCLEFIKRLIYSWF